MKMDAAGLAGGSRAEDPNDRKLLSGGGMSQAGGLEGKRS